MAEHQRLLQEGVDVGGLRVAAEETQQARAGRVKGDHQDVARRVSGDRAGVQTGGGAGRCQVEEEDRGVEVA